MKRKISFRAALSGTIRTAKFDGRDYLVVPVVALVEGVMHAVNAPNPELVLASEFEKVPDSWNGRPVLWDHPELNGIRVSASDPMVLEKMAFGQIFYSKVEDKSLKMEAWLDLAKAEKIPEAMAVVARVRASEAVEVSVGAFVDLDNRVGEFKGKKYNGAWKNIVPDHLALLPEGATGACSIEMGCGAPRAAAEGDKMTILQKFRAALEKFTDHIPPVGDSDVRSLLDQKLFATEPGFLGVVEVFSETSQVVYAVAPNGLEQHFRRSFEIVEGSPELKDDAEEVHLQTRYEPKSLAGKITEKDGRFCHMTPDGKEMCHDTMGEAEKMISSYKTASGGCGCAGGKKKEDAPASQEEQMKIEDRIKALIESKKTCFTAASAEVLAKLPESEIKALEDHVAAEIAKEKAAAPPPTPAKQLTQEEMLAQMPEVAEIVSQHKAAQANKKKEAIAFIAASAAHKDVYTTAELEAMSVESLEKLGKMVAASSVKTDQSGRALPRTEPDGEAIPAPPDMKPMFIAARSGQ